MSAGAAHDGRCGLCINSFKRVAHLLPTQLARATVPLLPEKPSVQGGPLSVLPLRTLGVFLLALIAIAVIAVLSMRATERLTSDTRETSRTLEVIASVERVLGLLTDAETGQRGYLLTMEERYLEPWERALRLLDEELERLRTLTREDFSQQRRLHAIEQLTREKLAELRQTIELQQQGAREKALAIVASGQGKALMDSLRRELAALNEQQEQLLRSTIAVTDRTSRQTAAVTLGGSALLGLLTLVAAASAARDLRRTHEAARAQLAAQQEAHRAAERYQLVVEGVRDYAIFLLDAEGRIASWNTGAERMTQWSEQEILGRPVSALYPPDKRPTMEEILQKAEEADHYEEEGVRLRKDGSTFEAFTTLTPLRHEDGSLRGFSKVTRDVSESARLRRELEQHAQQLESEVQRRTAELQASNAELEAFSYSVSHDLRAPLRAVDGFTQAILDDERNLLTPRAQDYSRRVRAAAQRMGNLIDDLLRLSRIARDPLNKRKVDVSALAEDVVADLRANEPGLTVEVNIAPNLTAEADLRLLQVALHNLLGNAFKFSGRRSDARVEFFETLQDGERVFAVRDNGVGFDMAYADKLFAPFQRLHNAADFAGTGIGLATVQRVIRRHGGRLWAESEPGKGATFFFTLGA